MNKRSIKQIAILVCSLASSTLLSYAPTNFYRPHDVDFRLFEWGKESFRIGALVEYGSTSDCRDWDENKENVLRMYNPHQSSLAMLWGAPKGSCIEKLAIKHTPAQGQATDTCERGRFDLVGSYEEWTCTAFLKYKLPLKSLPGIFQIDLFIPIKSMQYNGVSWTDRTENVLSADQAFKEEISSKLAAQAQALGNLDINQNGWSETGLGDTFLLLSWHQNFKQLDKEYLKNVNVNARIGISIPTGKEKDENKALALSLGNDGAWGIPIGLGLNLDFVYNMHAGIELDFLGFFDHTKVYRMKTSKHQTDYLLLQKGNATKTQGASWRFNLYGQTKHFLDHFGARVSYHFLKHDEDRLSPKSNDFDYNIINSAQSLKEWSSHTFSFELSYDLFNRKSSQSIKPQINLFYKLPIGGKRAILAHTFGGQISFNF